MKRMFATATIFAMLFAGGIASAAPTEDGNGYLMMVHATFEPRPEGPPPAQEAFVGTQDDGDIVLRLIPYTLDGLVPVEVSDPEVAVESLSGGSFTPTPSAGTNDAICEEETSLHDHEGPVAACLIVRVPADELAPADALLVTLRFADDGGEQVERYNAAAHIALHAAIEGAPVDPATVDATLTQPTPLLAETAVDPQP